MDWNQTEGLETDGGWMDRRMDGLESDGWRDGWMDLETDVWTDRWITDGGWRDGGMD